MAIGFLKDVNSSGSMSARSFFLKGWLSLTLFNLKTNDQNKTKKLKDTQKLTTWEKLFGKRIEKRKHVQRIYKRIFLNGY